MSAGTPASVRLWRREGTFRRGATEKPAGSRRARTFGSALLVGWAVTGSAMGAVAAPPPPQIAQVADSTFRHDRHAAFQCGDCHAMRPDHGVLLVTDVSDCRGCHHVPERSERECAACHEADELRDVVYPQDRILPLSVLDAPAERRLRFSHEAHLDRECVECHAGGPTLGVPDLDCQACHEDHHAATNPGCTGCHREPPEGAHPLEVHETCSGAGCHVDPPFQAPPPTRTGCLWCHEDMVDHEPGLPCVDCHLPTRPPALRTTGGDPWTP